MNTKQESYNNNYYLSEQCFYCQKEFIDINDILVDIEKDRYICQDCADKLNINTVPCLDIN